MARLVGILKIQLKIQQGQHAESHRKIVKYTPKKEYQWGLRVSLIYSFFFLGLRVRVSRVGIVELLFLNSTSMLFSGLSYI
jgi:hypothetical protein